MRYRNRMDFFSLFLYVNCYLLLFQSEFLYYCIVCYLRYGGSERRMLEPASRVSRSVSPSLFLRLTFTSTSVRKFTGYSSTPVRDEMMQSPRTDKNNLPGTEKYLVDHLRFEFSLSFRIPWVRYAHLPYICLLSPAAGFKLNYLPRYGNKISYRLFSGFSGNLQSCCQIILGLCISHPLSIYTSRSDL